MLVRYVANQGATIAYEVFGEPRPDGKALIFIPGWSCTADGWHDTARALSQDWRSLTVDLAGFGRSLAGTRTDWTLAMLGRDIAAVLEAENIDRAVLVGHSMGGAVALEAARMADGRVCAVVGADCFVYPELYDAVSDKEAAPTLDMLRADFPEAVRSFLEPYIRPGPGEAAARRQVATMMNAASQIAIAVMADFLRWDLTSTMDSVRVPVAVIGSTSLGQKDRTAPWRERVRFSWIDNVGHFVMVEAPETFRNHLLQAVEAVA